MWNNPGPIQNTRMQLTFVSHYGLKPAPFVERICPLQSVIAEQLGSRFKPYNVEQVHGTIIGLEGARFGTRIRNDNFRRFRRRGTVHRLSGVAKFLAHPAGVELGHARRWFRVGP